MARLIAALVRHGAYHQLQDTPSAHQPFPLTSEGEQQAVAAAETLHATIDRNGWVLEPVIDSSRMLRAWQTATIFANTLAGLSSAEMRIESLDSLAERSVGCAANLTIDQIETILHDDPRLSAPPKGWKADSRYCLPLQGAESLLEAGSRVRAHLSQAMSMLSTGGQDRLKIFIGHGAAFRHAAYHMGVLAFEQLRQLSMYHCQPVLLEYLPDDQWRHVGGDWKIRDSGNDFSD